MRVYGDLCVPSNYLNLLLKPKFHKFFKMLSLYFIKLDLSFELSCSVFF